MTSGMALLHDELEKHIELNALHERNESLFYHVDHG
jgi:hypothetical protein